MAVLREFFVPKERKLCSQEDKVDWYWNKRSYDFIIDDMLLEEKLLNKIRDAKRNNRLI